MSINFIDIIINMARPKNSVDKNTKTEILKTYIKLCYWEGADSVTLQKLAKQHKVAFNTVHYHFSQNLQSAAVEFLELEQKLFLERKLNKILAAGEKNALRGYLKTLFLWCDEQKDLASYWLHSFYVASTHQRSSGFWRDYVAGSRLQIKRLLLESIGQEAYPSLQNLDDLSAKIFGVMISSLFMRLTDPTISRDQHFSLCLSSIEALIRSHAKSSAKNTR